MFALSFSEIAKVVKGLTVSGCTALGPALSICAGYVSKTPSSEIVLCTDGEPNVGVGSAGSGDFKEFYRKVGHEQFFFFTYFDWTEFSC